MDTTTIINSFLEHCTIFRHMSPETIRAYSGDLRQYASFTKERDLEVFSPDAIKEWLKHMASTYKPRTIHRKVSSLKSFIKYTLNFGIIETDPFSSIDLKIKRSESFPKDIDLQDIERILRYAYQRCKASLSPAKHNQAVRNAVIIELLFATGIRISELCSLSVCDLDLNTGKILIHGKGNKERIVYIGNNEVINLLNQYIIDNRSTIHLTKHIFTSQQGKSLSGETIRNFLNDYASNAGVSTHITPHRFRHTFATALVNSDVNLRHIQTLLGHSSIRVTEIYTHVASTHHKDILREKHPRNFMDIC